MIITESKERWLNIKSSFCYNHVISSTVNYWNFRQGWKKSCIILMSWTNWWNLSEEAKEVSIWSCCSQDCAIFGKTKLWNSSSTFSNFKSFATLLRPVWCWIEFDKAVLSNSYLWTITAYCEGINRSSTTDINRELFLTERFLFDRHEGNDTLFKTNY